MPGLPGYVSLPSGRLDLWSLCALRVFSRIILGPEKRTSRVLTHARAWAGGEGQLSQFDTTRRPLRTLVSTPTATKEPSRPP